MFVESFLSTRLISTFHFNTSFIMIFNLYNTRIQNYDYFSNWKNIFHIFFVFFVNYIKRTRKTILLHESKVATRNVDNNNNCAIFWDKSKKCVFLLFLMMGN